MLADAVVEVLYDAAPTLLAASVGAGILAAIAWAMIRRAERDDREAEERWQDLAVTLDDILAEPWPEAEAVTGPIDVVTTGPTAIIPPAPVSCPHLSMLDRADGLRCPICEGVLR